MSTPSEFEGTVRNYSDQDILKVLQRPQDYRDDILDLVNQEVDRRGGINKAFEQAAVRANEQAADAADLGSKPDSGKGLQIGSILMVIGVGIGLFAFAHRPVTGFMDAAQRGDSWVFKSEPYYGILFIAALFVLAGILRIVLGVPAATAAKPSVSGESALDKIKKAKELLDAGAITAAEFEKIKKSALAL